MKHKFKIGDVVMFRSGGAVLVIGKIEVIFLKSFDKYGPSYKVNGQLVYESALKLYDDEYFEQ